MGLFLSPRAGRRGVRLPTNATRPRAELACGAPQGFRPAQHLARRPRDRCFGRGAPPLGHHPRASDRPVDQERDHNAGRVRRRGDRRRGNASLRSPAVRAGRHGARPRGNNGAPPFGAGPWPGVRAWSTKPRLSRCRRPRQPRPPISNAHRSTTRPSRRPWRSARG